MILDHHVREGGPASTIYQVERPILSGSVVLTISGVWNGILCLLWKKTIGNLNAFDLWCTLERGGNPVVYSKAFL